MPVQDSGKFRFAGQDQDATGPQAASSAVTASQASRARAARGAGGLAGGGGVRAGQGAAVMLRFLRPANGLDAMP